MSVGAQTPLNTYTGNGSSTVFAYSFYLISAADVLVTLDGVTKALTTDYTVSGLRNPSGAGGNITFVVAPLNGAAIRIKRNMAYQRTIQFQDSGDYKASVANDDMDGTVMLVQQLKRDTDRDLRLPETVAGVSATLPAPQALKLLRWNAVASALENADVAGLIPGYVTVTAFAQTLLQAVDAPGGRTTLGAAQDTLVPKLALPNVFTDTQSWKYNAIASAGALVLGAGNLFNVSGTATISTISSKGVGTLICLVFADVLTLTNSANLILPAATGITTSVGDAALFFEETAGNWRLISYQRAAVPIGVQTAFKVYYAGSPQGFLNGINTTVIFDTKLFDNRNDVTLGVGGKFTAPVAGVYAFSTGLTMDNPANAIPSFILLLNASTGGAQTTVYAAVGTLPVATAFGVFSLGAGGIVNVIANQNSGANLQNIPAEFRVYFQGFRIA